jgi:anthranilate phosphoribosyltransferase
VIADQLRDLLEPRSLTRAEARAIFATLSDPATDESDRVALLVALSARRRTTSDLVVFAEEMRRRARPFPIPRGDRAIDLCGSGGAPRPSFNVSTVAALVVRASGARVVKHGNRSRRVCGSSDLLEALGLPVTTSLPFARATYRRLGIAFLHAPLYHPATAAVAKTRQRLGIPTIFNRLGPLSNPARPSVQVSGTPDLASARETADALRALGVARGCTMVSDDGCDEFSPASPTTVVRWDGPRRARSRVHPDRLLPRDDRRGGWGALPPAEARDEAERILAGGGGARRGSVLLTSGMALAVSGRASSLRSGLEIARGALDGGGAEELLHHLRDLGERYRTEGRD